MTGCSGGCWRIRSVEVLCGGCPEGLSARSDHRPAVGGFAPVDGWFLCRPRAAGEPVRPLVRGDAHDRDTGPGVGLAGAQVDTGPFDPVAGRGVPPQDDASIRALTRLPGYHWHHVGPGWVPELAAEPELWVLFLALYLSQAKAAQAEVTRYTEIFALLEAAAPDRQTRTTGGPPGIILRGSPHRRRDKRPRRRPCGGESGGLSRHRADQVWCGAPGDRGDRAARRTRQGRSLA